MTNRVKNFKNLLTCMQNVTSLWRAQCKHCSLLALPYTTVLTPANVSLQLPVPKICNWKNSKFAPLAPLARRYLTISSSSVPVESIFSVTGVLMNGRRSSLVTPVHSWQLLGVQVRNSVMNRTQFMLFDNDTTCLSASWPVTFSFELCYALYAVVQ